MKKDLVKVSQSVHVASSLNTSNYLTVFDLSEIF